VAVVGSASEGLGQVASMLEAGGGTVVLVSTDFPSVTYPWLAAAERRGIELRFVEDRADRDLTQDLVDAIDPSTSVVTFGAVQYATGTQIEVARVAARAHDADARVVVDATQLAGAGPVDMGRWGADVVVTSGYKWLSSHGGVALLAIAPPLRDRLPQLVGWKGTGDPFAFDARVLRLADDARRFELSTMSYASAAGLETSVAILSSVGFDRIASHAAGLTARLVGQAEGLGWHPFREPGDPGASPHVVSLRHARHRPDTTAARLADRRVVCGGRGDGLRVSVHAYNDEADVERLVTCLRAM
jgi:selenocysteine lyase/cysteine desulfurase